MTPPPALTAYWAARTSRERILLAVLGALVCGLAFWYGAVAPLRTAARDAREARADSAERLVEARRYAAAAAARGRTGSTGDAAALDDLLARTAAETGLALDRRTPVPGGVQVSADAVPAPALFAWMAALRTRHGVSAVDAAILRGDAGTVQATITFAR